ncbi:Predicted P-loop ATPase, KAP-like [Tardiphaga sp. OK245]|nr:Predicted P-loop ATPase, KAP-like [Tardiphaga sp. OK245]
MSRYFNDSPIEKAIDDRYGITPFAKAIATSLLSIDKPVGTTIAINGPWGSGKSSAVNLIRTELDARKDETLNIVDFKCWWYRGEEAIALAFLQELNTALKPALSHKIKDAIPELGRYILQAGPVIGTAVSLATTGGVGALVSGGAAFAKRFFPEKDSLEKIFKKISIVLENQTGRFLIIIDDIDRLSPDEALAIFRLVKSVGRLPNVMYLLVFDRQLADAAVQLRYPSEGPHFLEKIIQASFELPAPSQTDLNSAVLSAVQDVCGSPSEQHMVRFMNLFYDAVVPFMNTPRHVTRLINAMSVTWPAVANEISRADYVVLETLRLYEPLLFAAIRRNREIVTGQTTIDQANHRDGSKFLPLLNGIPEGKNGMLRVILQRLFPALEDTSYGAGFAEIWDGERRVCLSKHFDTYFRMSLSDETISTADLNELIARSNDQTFVRERLHRARNQLRKSGKSMVPVVLDELTSHGKEIDREKVQDFLCALFSVVDDITRGEDDERGFAMANTKLRVHWLIRRVTADRFSLEEKTTLYLNATEVASIGWLIDFVSSAVDDYLPREGRSVDLSTCLVTEDAIPTLKDRAIEALRQAAKSGALLREGDLMYNIYRWRDFSDDGGVEVKAWLNEIMQDDAALVIIAKSLTGESWSTGLGGFGGLGDRVSRRNVRAQIGHDFDLFDTSIFKMKLERIVQESKQPEADIEAVQIFLNAWASRREDRGD